mgnify:CR=1 FL=1
MEAFPELNAHASSRPSTSWGGSTRSPPFLGSWPASMIPGATSRARVAHALGAIGVVDAGARPACAR